MSSSPRLTDPARLEALRQTGLLDRDPDPALQRLTRLASRLIRAPVSLVSLVDDERQFFASHIGLPEPWASRQQTPLSHSFCQHVVTAGEALIVSDARSHPVVRDNLAVEDLGVVAYAGMPLATGDGPVLGSFCVIDSEPREWTEDELETLRELAAAAMTEIELRRTAAALDDAVSRIRVLQELVPVCAWCHDIRDDEGFWNDLESYLAEHTGGHVSHGICPSCSERLSLEDGRGKSHRVPASCHRTTPTRRLLKKWGAASRRGLRCVEGRRDDEA